MATFTQDKKLTTAEIKSALKSFLPFSIKKIGENVADALITLIFMGITIAWIVTMQPIEVTFGEMTIYIITIFVLIVIQRII